jgi:hypothetical protein
MISILFFVMSCCAWCCLVVTRYLLLMTADQELLVLLPLGYMLLQHWMLTLMLLTLAALYAAVC